MSAYGPHWYSINDGILYPVDETASAQDALGKALPCNILADLALRWPAEMGRYAFLSAVAVTQTLVTITIQAATALDDSSSYVPLAVVSVPQPVEPGQSYPLQAQVPGVGGWVVFGAGVTQKIGYRGRFSGPAQTLLAPRAARSYRRLPVSSLKTVNVDTSLVDIVQLRAAPPLTIAKEQREIDGVLRDVLAVGLSDNATGFPVPTAIAQASGISQPSVFQQFAGPCAGRPESNTCDDPQPIQFIDAVGPDCAGQLTIEFQGCAFISQILGRCGIVIDCGLGLSSACLPPLIPSSDGLLPSEYEEAVIPPPPDVPVIPPTVESDSYSVGSDLPFLLCMQPVHTAGLAVVNGAWNTSADGDDPARPDGCHGTAASESVSSPQWSYESATAAVRNVSLWLGDFQTVYRRVTAGVMLLAGPVGSKHNAALVLNYRPHLSIAGLFVYYTADIDYDSQILDISHFDGTGFTIIQSTFVPGLQLDRWYKLQAIVRPGTDGAESTRIDVGVLDVEDGTVNTSITVTVTDYKPADGSMGMGTNRALSRFSYFQVEGEA